MGCNSSSPAGCYICDSSDSTVCTQCTNSYKPTPDNNVCQSCSAIYGSDCTGCSNTACTCAAPNTVPTSGSKAGQCSTCTEGFGSTCQGCTATACTCTALNVVPVLGTNQGSCVSSSTAYGPECTDCSDTGCTSCTAPNIVPVSGTNQGSWASCSTAYGPECTDCSDTACTACTAPSFIPTEGTYQGYCLSKTENSESHTRLILSIVLPVVLVSLLILAVLFFIKLKRTREITRISKKQAVKVEFKETGTPTTSLRLNNDNAIENSPSDLKTKTE